MQPGMPEADPFRPVPSPALRAGDEAFNENIAAASKELTAFLLAQYKDRNGSIHASSVVGAAAALTGEFAQRATGISLAPGKLGYVFGDSINGILFEDAAKEQATIWDCLVLAARDAGLSDKDIPDPVEVIKNVVGAVGGPSFPPITVPPQYFPHEYSPNACVRLRPKVIDIADRLDLSRRDLALALAMTTYAIILLTRDTLPPAMGVRLAAEIAFGVAKMSPLTAPLGDPVALS
jgi:hypothetical protein